MRYAEVCTPNSFAYLFVLRRVCEESLPVFALRGINSFVCGGRVAFGAGVAALSLERLDHRMTKHSHRERVRPCAYRGAMVLLFLSRVILATCSRSYPCCAVRTTRSMHSICQTLTAPAVPCHVPFSGRFRHAPLEGKCQQRLAVVGRCHNVHLDGRSGMPGTQTMQRVKEGTAASSIALWSPHGAHENA